MSDLDITVDVASAEHFIESVGENDTISAVLTERGRTPMPPLLEDFKNTNSYSGIRGL